MAGRPHFAPPEHLFDLRGGMGSHGDLFAWPTDDSPRLNTNREEITGAELERRIDDEFGEYRHGLPPTHPWTRGPNG